MPKTLIINNTPYNYPISGDEPGWGGDAVGWATGVTDVLSDLLGSNDILETTFNIANNQTTYADVTGLLFDTGSVRATEVSYSIFRVSTANPAGLAEKGTLHLLYDNAGWSIAQADIVGNSAVTFQVTGIGQIQYKSSDIGSLNYVGTMKFRAKSL